MPHFTLGITPEGPIVVAFVGVSQARLEALTTASQPIPQRTLIRALVDTGAGCSCVDPSVLSGLGLAPTGSVPMNTPSTGSTPHMCSQYDVSLTVPGASTNHATLHFATIPVVATDLFTAQGIHALIGRDILSECVMVYNGNMGQFTLGY